MPHRTRRASPQLQLDPTWTTKHTATLRLAEAYDAIGLPSNGARCRTCGIGILYLESPAHGRQSLAAAHFCRDRLCPTCSWRRSRRLSAQADNVLRAATAAHPSRSFVLLTLTQRNVAGEALPLEISRILTGWRLLTRKTEFSEIAGWFRSVEITHNEKRPVLASTHSLALVDSPVLLGPRLRLSRPMGTGMAHGIVLNVRPGDRCAPGSAASQRRPAGSRRPRGRQVHGQRQ